MKSILLSIDLLFACLIFIAVLAFASLAFEYENKPSLYYYDASNALEFMDEEIQSKSINAINDSIYNYLGFKEYYFEMIYYNSSGMIEKISQGDLKMNSNYCSEKFYQINNELIHAKLCIGRDYQ